MQRTTHHNIRKLYLIKVSKWFMLYMPYIVPFYTENGLNMQQIMILQAVYSVSIVALEIPSGYFADVIGRRRTMIIGTVMGFIGFSVYGFSFGFMGFLIAELILGVGQSFISGADSALLYDSLLDQKQQDRYIRYEGRMVSLGNIAEASAGIIGGFIALISLRTNFYAQAGVAFLAVPASILLVEPGAHLRLRNFTWRTILGVVRVTLFSHKQLRTNIFLSAIIGCSTLTMAWFAQPYFAHVELPLSLYGMAWTTLNLTVGLAAITAYRVESRMGSKNLVLAIAILIPGGYLIMGQLDALWGLSVLFLFYILRGIATPVLKDYIHRLTNSEVRATVLSVRNFIIRLVFVGVGPLMGLLTDRFGLSMALTMGGSFFLVTGLMLALLFRRYNS